MSLRSQTNRGFLGGRPGPSETTPRETLPETLLLTFLSRGGWDSNTIGQNAREALLRLFRDFGARGPRTTFAPVCLSSVCNGAGPM